MLGWLVYYFLHGVVFNPFLWVGLWCGNHSMLLVVHLPKLTSWILCIMASLFSWRVHLVFVDEIHLETFNLFNFFSTRLGVIFISVSLTLSYRSFIGVMVSVTSLMNMLVKYIFSISDFSWSSLVRVPSSFCMSLKLVSFFRLDLQYFQFEFFFAQFRSKYLHKFLIRVVKSFFSVVARL